MKQLGNNNLDIDLAATLKSFEVVALSLELASEKANMAAGTAAFQGSYRHLSSLNRKYIQLESRLFTLHWRGVYRTKASKQKTRVLVFIF